MGHAPYADWNRMPEDHHRKGLLEDYYREELLHKPRATMEDVLYETERDAFTDGYKPDGMNAEEDVGSEQVDADIREQVEADEQAEVKESHQDTVQ